MILLSQSATTLCLFAKRWGADRLVAAVSIGSFDLSN